MSFRTSTNQINLFGPQLAAPQCCFFRPPIKSNCSLLSLLSSQSLLTNHNASSMLCLAPTNQIGLIISHSVKSLRVVLSFESVPLRSNKHAGSIFEFCSELIFIISYDAILRSIQSPSSLFSFLHTPNFDALISFFSVCLQFVVRCSLFVVRCSLFIIRQSPFVVHRSSFVVLRLVTHVLLLFVVCYLLFVLLVLVHSFIFYPLFRNLLNLLLHVFVLCSSFYVLCSSF